MNFQTLTFNLLFWCFDVAQHAGHVDAVPVHVLEEDIGISPGQSARLREMNIHRSEKTLKVTMMVVLIAPTSYIYLEEGFLLLQVFADHRGHVVRFTVGSQFVSSATPVLFSLILLFQALQHTADLWPQTHSSPVLSFLKP